MPSPQLSFAARPCSWHARCDLRNLTQIDERVQTGMAWDVRHDKSFLSGPAILQSSGV